MTYQQIKIENPYKAFIYKVVTLVGLMILIASSIAWKNAYMPQNLDDNEELYRLGLMQIYKRDYPNAIETYLLILERDSTECLAAQLLSELYLVKGLSLVECEGEVDCERSNEYFEKSIVYSQQVLDTFDGDLPAHTNMALALNNLALLEYPSNEKSSAFLIKSIEQIQEGFDVNMSYADLWFALGEWWYAAENFSEEERNTFFKKYFPLIDLGTFDDYSCFNEYAQNSYTIAVRLNENSVLGNYGLMRTALIDHNIDLFTESYNNVHFFSNYMPLEYYYAGKVRFIWEYFWKKEKRKGKNIPLRASNGSEI